VKGNPGSPLSGGKTITPERVERTRKSSRRDVKGEKEEEDQNSQVSPRRKKRDAPRGLRKEGEGRGSAKKP